MWEGMVLEPLVLEQLVPGRLVPGPLVLERLAQVQSVREQLVE